MSLNYWESPTSVTILNNHLSTSGTAIESSSTLTTRRSSKINSWSCYLLVTTFVILSQSAGDASDRIFVSGSRLLLGTEQNRTASVRIGDLDDDGDLDVAVANGRHWPQQNFLLINQGQARFNVQRTLGPTRSTSYATELGDLDGDGDLDIAVGNDMAPNRIFFNRGAGEFGPGMIFGEISSIRSLTLSDLDGDQDLDILACSRGRANQIYLNDGSGRFGSGRPFGSAGDSTIDVAVGDLNLDGHPDLVLANRDNQQNYLLLNDGNTNFDQRVAFGNAADQTRAVAVADVNGDGNPDLVAANIGQPNAIYFCDGHGHVGEQVTFGRHDGQTYALSVADLDKDGDPDLIAGNVAQENAVYMNESHGHNFREIRFGDAASATYGLDSGDLNGDGFQDIVVANSGTENRVYLNRRRRK